MRNHIKGILYILIVLSVFSSDIFALDADISSHLIISLNDAIQLALKNNSDLKDAEDSLSGSMFDLDIAKSEFSTRFNQSLSTDYVFGTQTGRRFDLSFSKKLRTGTVVEVNTGTTNLDTSHLSEIRTRIRQPLLRGFGLLATSAGIMDAERRILKRKNLIGIAREQLILNVILNYYRIVRKKKIIDVHQKSLLRAKKLLEAGRAKLEAGMVSRMDLFRAEIRLSETGMALADSKDASEDSKDSLKILLGLPMDTRIEVDSKIDYKPVDADLSKYVDLALKNRPEIREAEAEINDAKRRVKIARWNLLPSVDLSLNYSRYGTGNNFEDSIDLNDERYGIGLISSLTLDRASEKASHQRALIDLRKRERDHRLIKENIIREVRHSIRNLSRNVENIEIQKRNVEQAEKILELAMIRYRKGLSDNLSVIEAEENLIKTKSNYITAMTDYIVSRAGLKKVAGILE
ncbi:MAG: TolC family protein [Nitrospinota bacterium]